MSINYAELAAYIRTRSSGRDPAYWPGATYGFWNYPIGSNATYAALGVSFDNSFYINAGGNGVAVAVCASSDAVGTLVRSGTDGLGIFSTNTFNHHLRSDIPDNLTSDQIRAIIMPDHRVSFESEGSRYNAGTNTATNTATSTVWDTQGPLWGASIGGGGGIPLNYLAEGPSVAYRKDGFGCKASGVSVIGGLLRPGELKNGIPHGLAMAAGDLIYNGTAPGGSDHVWPATSVDGGFGGRGHTNTSNVYYGSLLAIPPSTNVNTLGLCPEALNMFLAAQQYGIYCVDAGGNSQGIFLLDWYATSDYPGFPGYTGTTSQATFESDLKSMRSLLRVITNSHNNGAQPQGYATSNRTLGIKIAGGDGLSLLGPIAPAFAPAWGGGDGRV